MRQDCAQVGGAVFPRRRAGLADRNSRPHRLRCPTAPAVAEQVITLRRQRLLMKHIAAQLELSIATMSRLNTSNYDMLDRVGQIADTIQSNTVTDTFSYDSLDSVLSTTDTLGGTFRGNQFVGTPEMIGYSG